MEEKELDGYDLFIFIFYSNSIYEICVKIHINIDHLKIWNLQKYD